MRNENGTGGIRSLTSDYIYHKRYSNQDSMVLTHTHTHTKKYGSMEQDSKEIVGVNNTIEPMDLTGIQNTTDNSRIQILFSHTCNTFQDRPCTRPQNKS